MESIKIFMNEFYMTFVSRGAFPNLIKSKLPRYGPKFYKAIMRRLGFDSTYRINFREFVGTLRLAAVNTIESEFEANLNNSRVNLAKTHHSSNIRRKIRDCEDGTVYENHDSHVGPLKAFRNIGMNKNRGGSQDHSNTAPPQQKLMTFSDSKEVLPSKMEEYDPQSQRSYAYE